MPSAPLMELRLKFSHADSCFTDLEIATNFYNQIHLDIEDTPLSKLINFLISEGWTWKEINFGPKHGTDTNTTDSNTGK